MSQRTDNENPYKLYFTTLDIYESLIQCNETCFTLQAVCSNNGVLTLYRLL